MCVKMERLFIEFQNERVNIENSYEMSNKHEYIKQ